MSEQTRDGSAFRRILDEAIDSEIESGLFYRQAAGKMKEGHIKAMFLLFAGEEDHHRRMLEAFRSDDRRVMQFDRVVDYHLAETITAPALSVEMKPADAIALAIKKEETAMQRYRGLAQACRIESEKEVFLELAAMEQGHKTRMEQAFVDIGFPEVW